MFGSTVVCRVKEEDNDDRAARMRWTQRRLFEIVIDHERLLKIGRL